MSQPDPTLRPEPLDGDADRALRPQTLDAFIGQAEARANLKVFIASARQRGEAMDHTLFHGPPGLGKTTLAGILANAMDANLRVTSGPALERPGDLAAVLTNLEEGDVLFIDTGATYDGYFCDFDRNFAFGHLSDDAQRAHEAVWDATEAGIAAARPGATTTDLWRAMADVLEAAGSKGLNVGRMGHGLGLQLTEPPSNRPGDPTELQPGMVMTIEPGLEYAPGKNIVHEENIVITDDGCELLTRRAPLEMPLISR